MPIDQLKETPSQTAGPYVHIGLLPAQAGLRFRTQEKLSVVAGPAVAGEHIRIEGTVYDGAGAIVRDAVLELWQADSHGRYNGPDFGGFGRSGADPETGRFAFETIKPGPVKAADGRVHAPHVTLYVFARGINIHLHTRCYFSDEAEANAADPVLSSIEQRHLVPTLVATREQRGRETVYVFDIHLQGEKETIFFDM